MDDRLVIPDHVPDQWHPPQPKCVCAAPLPQTRAAHKGAAQTTCARCGLPIRIEFAPAIPVEREDDPARRRERSRELIVEVRSTVERMWRP